MRSLLGAISFDFYRFTISFVIDVYPSSEPALEPAPPNSRDFLCTEFKNGPPPWLLVLVVFGGSPTPPPADPGPPIFAFSIDSFINIFC